MRDQRTQNELRKSLVARDRFTFMFTLLLLLRFPRYLKRGHSYVEPVFRANAPFSCSKTWARLLPDSAVVLTKEAEKSFLLNKYFPKTSNLTQAVKIEAHVLWV
jgi:hypothetical protein